MNKPEFVTTIKAPFAERYDNFIGGQWVAPKSGKYFDNISPVTGKVVCKIARSRNHDLMSAGYLAVTAAGFVLLCSSLLACAFS
jgi:aldehyde dehydrogenase